MLWGVNFFTNSNKVKNKKKKKKKKEEKKEEKKKKKKKGEFYDAGAVPLALRPHKARSTN